MKAVLRVDITWFTEPDMERDLVKRMILYRNSATPHLDGSEIILFFSEFRFEIVHWCGYQFGVTDRQYAFVFLVVESIGLGDIIDGFLP
jgi:hypothetical protein